MTDYLFEEVAVYDSLGGTLRLLRNGLVSVLNPTTGLPAAGLKVGGVSVTSPIRSDANGQLTFTSTIETVRLVSPNGLRKKVTSSDAIEAAAAAGVSNDAGVASYINNAASATRVAGDGVYSPLTVGGKQAVRKNDLVINVKDAPYNAVGDGVATGNQVGINSAITAAAGRTVLVPAGTYLIDAVAGIKMWTAGVRLLLEPGAVIKAAPNNAAGYSMIEVNAADCVIEGGGTIEGDGIGHTGVTGEQGHCIVTAAGATRLRIENVTVTKAWGDGIALQSGAVDVSVINVTAIDNRRQGMSIIQAVRPRVYGGIYKDTGLSQNTSPSAGIDVEPNTTNQVTDCVISGVTFAGNRGPGLQVATATGGLAEVTVTGCTSVDSTIGSGYYFVGPADTIKAKVSGCTAVGNALNGFTVVANKVELSSCAARSNTQIGFLIQESDTLLVDSVAVENGRNGITIASTSQLRTRIVGGVTRANSQTTSGSYINLDNFGVDTTIIGHVTDAGQLTNKPAWGYVIRTSSTARLVGCDVVGSFVTAQILDQPGNTYMLPRPGAADPGFSGATVGTTAPAAGGAGALPATPLGYVTVTINGTARKIAYYA